MYLRRFQQCPLVWLRHFCLRLWRRSVTKSFLRYLNAEYGPAWTTHRTAAPGVEAGRECIWRTTAADWWEWKLGSRIFFWRWPPAHRSAARDGYPPMVSGELPRYKQPQRSERHASFQAKVSEKLEDIRRKAYIMGGRVDSLTTFFWVPKGEQDIRLVYDTTKSGLNQALWAPTFGMPTVENLVKGVMDYSWMGDMDISEMFLNFNLHPDLHPYCGIDLSAYQEGEEGGLLWERWVRCMMGLKISPYVTIKGFQLAMEVVRGNRRSFRNPLRWTRVKKKPPWESIL